MISLSWQSVRPHHQPSSKRSLVFWRQYDWKCNPGSHAYQQNHVRLAMAIYWRIACDSICQAAAPPASCWLATAWLAALYVYLMGTWETLQCILLKVLFFIPLKKKFDKWMPIVEWRIDSTFFAFPTLTLPEPAYSDGFFLQIGIDFWRRRSE